MSTAGTIARRTPLVGVNNPAYQVSLTAYNDSLVVASAAADGSIFVRDSTKADGWGFDPLPAAAAGTLTGATLAANVLASSLTSLGTLSALAVSAAAPVFTRDALVITSTDGLVLQNTTASTAGVPVQQSARVRFRANVWNTTTPANNTDDWVIESVPASAAVPLGGLKFGSSLNGAAVTFPLQIRSDGIITIGGTNRQLVMGSMLLTSTALQLPAAGLFYWDTRSIFTSPANGQLNATNFAASAGVGLDVATDATLKIRTRAQTGDATLMALDGIFSGNVTASSGSMTTGSNYNFNSKGRLTAASDGVFGVFDSGGASGSLSALLFKVMTAIVAAGGGAAPTFTTIGGSGPATAAQNGWLKFTDSGGAACYVPVWK